MQPFLSDSEVLACRNLRSAISRFASSLRAVFIWYLSYECTVDKFICSRCCTRGVALELGGFWVRCREMRTPARLACRWEVGRSGGSMGSKVTLTTTNLGSHPPSRKRKEKRGRGGLRPQPLVPEATGKLEGHARGESGHVNRSSVSLLAVVNALLEVAHRTDYPVVPR